MHADKRVVVENMDPRLDTSSGLVSGATIIAESLLHLIESMLLCIEEINFEGIVGFK